MHLLASFCASESPVPSRLPGLPRSPVELLEVPRPARLALNCHDVTVCWLHGQLTVLTLLHAAPGSPADTATQPAEIRVYQANKYVRNTPCRLEALWHV